MEGNKGLREASKAKKDEFYTQLSDIANELKHYKNHFKDKVVLCNCDDPYESNFSKYFMMMFNEWGLKKLICTCWNGSPITGKELDLFGEKPTQDSRSRVAYKLELTKVEDLTGDGVATLEDVQLYLQKNKPTLLQGNGDFRSQECIDLLKEADIVVTNPPFSLFREYVAQLMEYDKRFLIIGNQNAITYKEIFPLLKDNKIWLGFHSGHTLFSVPEYYNIPDFYDLSDTKRLKANGYVVDKNGKLWRNLGNICWFTNLDHKKRHYPLDLYKHYTPEEYPKYDNYDAIEVSKTADIPMDYDGVMGVPISFLDKYCPEQFEIVGMAKRGAGDPALKSKVYTKEDYPNYSDLNAGPALFDKTGNLYNTYPRILIRKKQ